MIHQKYKVHKDTGLRVHWDESNEYRVKHVIASCEDVLLDGVERPIQRPQASDLQKASYSGKKNS